MPISVSLAPNSLAKFGMKINDAEIAVLESSCIMLGFIFSCPPLALVENDTIRSYMVVSRQKRSKGYILNVLRSSNKRRNVAIY